MVEVLLRFHWGKETCKTGSTLFRITHYFERQKTTRIRSRTRRVLQECCRGTARYNISGYPPSSEQGVAGALSTLQSSSGVGAPRISDTLLERDVEAEMVFANLLAQWSRSCDAEHEDASSIPAAVFLKEAKNEDAHSTRYWRMLKASGCRNSS